MKVRLSLYLSSLTGKADDINARRHKGRLLIYKNPDQKHKLDERKKLIQKNTAFVTKHWREMLESKRKLWATASVGKLGNSRNGEKYRLGGYQYYLKVNLRRVHAGLPIAENPYYIDTDAPVFEIGHTWWTIDPDPKLDDRFGGHWEQVEEMVICNTQDNREIGIKAEGIPHSHVIKSRLTNSEKQACVGYASGNMFETIDEWDNSYKYVIGGTGSGSTASRNAFDSTARMMYEREHEGSTSWEKLKPENFPRYYIGCWQRVS